MRNPIEEARHPTESPLPMYVYSPENVAAVLEQYEREERLVALLRKLYTKTYEQGGSGLGHAFVHCEHLHEIDSWDLRSHVAQLVAGVTFDLLYRQAESNRLSGVGGLSQQRIVPLASKLYDDISRQHKDKSFQELAEAIGKDLPRENSGLVKAVLEIVFTYMEKWFKEFTVKFPKFQSKFDQEHSTGTTDREEMIQFAKWVMQYMYGFMRLAALEQERKSQEMPDWHE